MGKKQVYLGNGYLWAWGILCSFNLKGLFRSQKSRYIRTTCQHFAFKSQNQSNLHPVRSQSSSPSSVESKSSIRHLVTWVQSLKPPALCGKHMYVQTPQMGGAILLSWGCWRGRTEWGPYDERPRAREYVWRRACASRCLCASACACASARGTHLPYSRVCSHAARSRGDTDKRTSPPCWCTRAGSRRCPCCTRPCLWETHMQHVTHVETAQRRRQEVRRGGGGVEREWRH